MARAVGRERKRKGKRCMCAFECVREMEKVQDRAGESWIVRDKPKQAAFTKIAQARIFAGNINLSMMSVIKLRGVRHAT